MKKLLAFFLTAFFLTHVGAAAPAALLNAERSRKASVVTPERIWAELKQPGAVVHVNVENNPSPFMSGFQGGECQLLVNDKIERVIGVAQVVFIAHEAGHCEAVKAGVHKPGETTKQGEGFADVYALAWISVNRPEQFDEAYQILTTARKQSRLFSGAYDTLYIMNLARVSLPVKTNPTSFALEITK